MPKYTQDVKDKAVEMARNGVALAEIQRQLGCNPKAIQRYCEKAGYALPKKPRGKKKSEE